MRKAANRKRRGNSSRRPDPPEGAEFTSRCRTRSAVRRAKARRCAQAGTRQAILPSSSGKTKTAARPTRCSLPTKISKTTPCKVAWWSLAWMLSATPRKHFDTSGKSAALFHHRAICKTPIALPKNRRFGAIAVKKSLPTIEVPPARSRARKADWSRRRNPPFQATSRAQDRSRRRRPEISARRAHRSFRCRRPNRPETFSRARRDEPTNVEAADCAGACHRAALARTRWAPIRPTGYGLSQLRRDHETSHLEHKIGQAAK